MLKLILSLHLVFAAGVAFAEDKVAAGSEAAVSAKAGEVSENNACNECLAKQEMGFRIGCDPQCKAKLGSDSNSCEACEAKQAMGFKIGCPQCNSGSHNRSGVTPKGIEGVREKCKSCLDSVANRPSCCAQGCRLPSCVVPLECNKCPAGLLLSLANEALKECKGQEGAGVDCRVVKVDCRNHPKHKCCGSN